MASDQPFPFDGVCITKVSVPELRVGVDIFDLFDDGVAAGQGAVRPMVDLRSGRPPLQNRFSDERLV